MMRSIYIAIIALVWILVSLGTWKAIEIIHLILKILRL